MLEALNAFSEVFLPIVIIAAVGYALEAASPLDIRSLNSESPKALLWGVSLARRITDLGRQNQ